MARRSFLSNCEQLEDKGIILKNVSLLLLAMPGETRLWADALHTHTLAGLTDTDVDVVLVPD